MTTSSGKYAFFSLVIPVYNRLDLLQGTVQSVLEQEFRNFQVIIVDDGSNDGTGLKLDELYSGNDLIKVVHQQNAERGAARNKGFRESSGDYVIFLDSDDLLLPNHLEVLFKKITDLDMPDFIATKYEFVQNGRRLTSSIRHYKEGYYDYRLFLDGNPFGCNVCVRRKNEQISLFEEDRRLAIKEDWLFFLKNLRYHKLYLIDKVTLLMQDHEGRSMRGDNEILVSKTKLALEWIQCNIELSQGESKKLLAHVNYFCAIHTYLDFHRIRSLKYILQAFMNGGFRMKYFMLLGKITVGRKMIMRLKHGS